MASDSTINFGVYSWLVIDAQNSLAQFNKFIEREPMGQSEKVILLFAPTPAAKAHFVGVVT